MDFTHFIILLLTDACALPLCPPFLTLLAFLSRMSGHIDLEASRERFTSSRAVQ